MNVTGKTLYVPYMGKTLRICNQRCRAWNTPYGYQGSKETLSNAGCGIFSIAHAVNWMNGLEISPDELGTFSVLNGGRGDDGTDRPALLHAMQEKGLARQFGFEYREDGLRNDLETLYEHLKAGNTGLGNLRVGHIVALLEAREIDGEKQVLAADPYSESNHERVVENIRECIEGSEIETRIVNGRGVFVSQLMTFAVYWVPLGQVHDFNLLYRLRG